MTRKNFAKSAFVAAAVVATSVFAFQPSEAEAKVNFSFNVVVAPTHGPNTAPPPRHKPAPAPNRRLSCYQVGQILRNQHGFRNIQAYDCKGKSYWYYAFKNGIRYRVKMASTGQYIRHHRG